MVALTDLIVAQTTEDYEALREEFRAERAKEASDAEVLTEALRACTDGSGEPLLDAGEYAEIVSGKVRIRKAN